MISTLELEQFRGIEHVKFENLGRVNLIVGGNNVGKTSVLEALVMLHGNDVQYRHLPDTFRVQPRSAGHTHYWEFLPKSGHEACNITGDRWGVQISKSGGRNYLIDGHSKQIRRRLGLDTEETAPSFDISIIATRQNDPAEVSELFNRVAPLNPDNEAKIEELAREAIDPRLRRLRYAKPQGQSTHLVYADLGDGAMLPFTQLGQAFSRTLEVYCEIFANRPKILLIDEIENGLYHEGLEDYWKGLMGVLIDQDVQLFATTHSRECMEAAHRAAARREDYPLRFLRLDRRTDDPYKIVATTFGKKEMETAIEFKKEMR